MGKKQYQTDLENEDLTKTFYAKVDQVQEKVLDILDEKLNGGGNIDYCLTLSQIYKNLK